MKKYDGIIIDDAHADKIKKLLDDAQGTRAYARTLTTADVMGAMEKLDRKAMSLFGSKKYIPTGAWTLNPCAQTYPKAYKYRPAHTLLRVAYAGGKWRLLGVERVEMDPHSSSVSSFITDAPALDPADVMRIAVAATRYVYSESYLASVVGSEI